MTAKNVQTPISRSAYEFRKPKRIFVTVYGCYSACINSCSVLQFVFGMPGKRSMELIVTVSGSTGHGFMHRKLIPTLMVYHYMRSVRVDSLAGITGVFLPFLEPTLELLCLRNTAGSRSLIWSFFLTTCSGLRILSLEWDWYTLWAYTCWAFLRSFRNSVSLCFFVIASFNPGRSGMSEIPVLIICLFTSKFSLPYIVFSNTAILEILDGKNNRNNFKKAYWPKSAAWQIGVWKIMLSLRASAPDCLTNHTLRQLGTVSYLFSEIITSENRVTPVAV